MKYHCALSIARRRLTINALALVMIFFGIVFTPLAIGFSVFNEERSNQITLSFDHESFNDRFDEVDTLNQIQHNTRLQPETPIERSEAASLGEAPQSPQGNFNGIRIEATPPHLAAYQEQITTADHIMQLIGNPIRTLLAFSEDAAFGDDTSIGVLQVFAPNDLSRSEHNLLEVKEYLRSINDLLQFRSPALPEYQTCLEHFNQTSDLLDQALQLLHNKKTLLSVLNDSIESVRNANEALTTSLQNLHTARAAAAALMPPGAYHVSAEEAARDGIFAYHESLPPREAAKATPVDLPIAHLQALPEGNAALRLLRKAPYSPDKLSIVPAEAPIMMVHGIPVAEATIAPQQ